MENASNTSCLNVIDQKLVNGHLRELRNVNFYWIYLKKTDLLVKMKMIMNKQLAFSATDS